MKWEVGFKLKRLRNERNLTQMELADILGVSQATINRYENEGTEMTYENLVRTANYFDISLDFLLGRCEEQQGKLYNCELEEFRNKIEHNAEWCHFVESCFDSSSPMGKVIIEELKKFSRGRKRN